MTPWPAQRLACGLGTGQLLPQLGKCRLALGSLLRAGLLPQLKSPAGVDDIQRLDFDLLVEPAELWLDGRKREPEHVLLVSTADRAES